jgi:phosphoribosylaminoimidazole-succinocarboxamide synthase
MTVLERSALPLPLLRRGKVREVYEVDAEHLLLVASDRVSAFDVVMREAVPHKGAVLTQLSAFWFDRFGDLVPSHYVTADAARIVERLPVLAGAAAQLAGRAMLVRRTEPVPFECVVRGYLAGSAWNEYRERGTLAGEALPPALVESARLRPSSRRPRRRRVATTRTSPIAQSLPRSDPVWPSASARPASRSMRPGVSMRSVRAF